MDGYKVLLVDLDPQANATLHLGINHVVREKEGKTMRRVFRQEVELADIIHTDERTGLDLASSSIDVSEVESALNADASGAFMLNQILEDARRTYDFIFLDCPPNLGPLTANGLVASDLVIIPCQTEFFASSGVGLLLRTINNLRSRCRLSVDVLGILPTMYNSSLNQHRATLEEMHVEFGSKFRIFPAVPRATVYGEAAMSGRAALEAMPSAPGAAEYDVLRQAIVEARRKRVEVANAA
jgi:chromosome partitioning protein